jgi:hypothetical protein
VLRKASLATVQQRGIAMMCDGIVVGKYNVDLLTEEVLPVE